MNQQAYITHLEEKVILQDALHRDHEQISKSELPVIGALGTFLVKRFLRKRFVKNVVALSKGVIKQP